MATIIEGKAVAQTVRAELECGASAIRAKYAPAPGLHGSLAGRHSAAAVYVRNKEKAAEEVGIAGKVHRLPATVSQDALLGLVRELNADAAVDGILVQLPLPSGLDSQVVVQSVDPAKDVDGLH